MSFEACMAAIRKEIPDLDTDDLDEIAADLVRRQRRIVMGSPLKDPKRAFAEAANEIAQEQRMAAIVEKRNRAINVLRKRERLDRYASMPGDEAAALSELIVGSNRREAFAGASTAAKQVALRGKMLGGLLGELRREGLDGLLRGANKDFERDIARNLWSISKGEARTGSKEAQRAAEIINKWQEAARKMQNDAGAWIRKLPGYIVTQSHDMFRIGKAGFDTWRASIEPKLDAAATFGDMGPAQKELFLKNVYNALVTGVHYRERGAGDWLGGFKGPGNLAKKASQERVLHFKSADDWYAYNEEFGSSSLLESVTFGIEKAADNTALMRTWGTNPEAAYLADLDYLKQRAANRGDAKMTRKLSGWLLKSQFDQVNGAARIPGNPTIAQINAVVRAVTSMATLGGSTLSSLPDIAVKAASLRHNGIGLLEAYGNSFGDILRGRGNDEQRQIAESIGVGLDGLLGSITSRFTAQDSVPGRIAKLQSLFYRFNLQTFWTDGKAVGTGLILSHNLGRKSGIAYSALDDALKASLLRHGIAEREWAVLSKLELVEANGSKYLLPDPIADLPDKVIAPLADGTSEAALRRARDALEEKLRTYYTDETRAAITEPGARERAILTLGTQKGTLVGEAVRYLTQFKLYPLAFATRHVGRELANPSTMGAVHMIVGTTILGYLSMVAKDLSKGRTPRDPNDIKTWTAAMIQGGGLGIYGDFLFGEYNRFGGGLLETAGGPMIGKFNAVLRAFANARDAIGSDDPSKILSDVGGDLVKEGINSVPFINLFYTRAALDYLFLYQVQEALSPGYLRRMERRIKKENGQAFILSPAQAVAAAGPFAGAQ